MEKMKGFPSGWASTTIGEVASYINGRAFKPIEWEDEGTPIIRIQNLNNSKAKYNYSKEIFEERYKVSNGDLLFAWSASLGAYIWNNGDAWLNQHIFKVIPKECIIKKFLYYKLYEIVHVLYSKTHGSGMVHITKAKFEETEILLPPLAEQHRIVCKIEELFSELDKGIESLNTAQQQLKVYRQTVLKWAFEGKLIEGQKKEEWEMTTLGEFVEEIRIGPFGTLLHESDYIVDGVPLINPKHIRDQKIYPESKVSVSSGKLKELSSYVLKKNDIILGRRGEMGRCAPITDKEHGWICGTGSMIIRMKEGNSAKLYSLLIEGKKIRNYLESNCTGTTMKNLNEKIVCNVPVPIIPIEEQDLLISEIELRLSICDKMEETIEECLAKTETLRQSILKKAFEGNLVSQHPSNEPTEKLLDRIRHEETY